ncbi:MAG: hypothetical protein ACYDEX_21955 [Mobilitalea sp.]
MKTIKIGETDSFELRNQNVAGFIIKIVATADAVNEDPTFAYYKPTIKAKLKQSDFNDTIVEGTICGLAKGTNTRLEKWVGVDAQGSRVVTAKGAAVVGVLEIFYKINLPTVINLNGDDVMTVEVVNPADSCGNHNTVGTYLGIEPFETSGSQSFIPRIKEYTLPTLETKYEKSVGSNVTRVVFVASSTNDVVADGLTQLDIWSDRLDHSFDASQIQYECDACQSNSLIAIQEEVDQLKIKATMDGILNAAGDLRMIVTDYYVNRELAITGAERTAKHRQKLANKIDK